LNLRKNFKVRMQLSVRRFKGDNGERFAILVDATGMPLFYPSLYVTAVLRGGGLALNTISNALTAIKVLYAWQDYYGVDLESRFKCSELLQPQEIHGLRDFVQIPLTSAKKFVGKVRPINPKVNLVGAESQYSRMSVIADYLQFLADRLHPRTVQSGEAIKQMFDQINANRPKAKNKSAKDRDEIHVEEAILNAIADALEPGSRLNPVKDFSVQVRNALMFVVLRATGFRRSELLNLMIEDCDFNNNTIKVVRRADSLNDDRNYQPVAKTLGRTMPVLPGIMESIEDYIRNYRAKVPGVNKHGYLFVTHKAGRYQGRPISNSGFGKFLYLLSNSVVEFNGVHSHALRHHWNYTFSITMDEKGVSPEREQKLRSKLMGWKETSPAAAVYNRRHIKAEADEAVISMQKRQLGVRKSRGDV
jgi:integrase